MILNVFDGNGLPSMDIKSLQMMAFAKFLKVDIEIVKKTFKPYVGCKLPELICEKGSITELEDFIEYLKFEAGSTLHLSEQKLDIRYKSYEILFEETLKPALFAVLWSDEKNYAEKTRGSYSKITSFPLNYFVPSYLRNQAITYLDSVYPIKYRRNYFSIELIEKAKEIIKLLSDTLANSKYFNGNEPNEIDALIFGYLAVILKTELPRLNNLQQFIEERKNLVSYVNRVLNEYFPEHFVNQAAHTTKAKSDTKENSFESATWRSLFIISLFAVTSNLLYILYLISGFDDADEVTDSESDDE